MFGNVQTAMNRRLASITGPDWVADMTELIRRQSPEYFRWHDSGDLQSMDHLRRIVQIATNLPETRFWLPTREMALVKEYRRQFGQFPPNLVVRVSGAMIDGPPPQGFAHTSTVTTKGWNCVSDQHENTCGPCRACWDHRIKNISYRAH